MTSGFRQGWTSEVIQRGEDRVDTGFRRRQRLLNAHLRVLRLRIAGFPDFLNGRCGSVSLITFVSVFTVVLGVIPPIERLPTWRQEDIGTFLWASWAVQAGLLTLPIPLAALLASRIAEQQAVDDRLVAIKETLLKPLIVFVLTALAVDSILLFMRAMDLNGPNVFQGADNFLIVMGSLLGLSVLFLGWATLRLFGLVFDPQPAGTVRARSRGVRQDRLLEATRRHVDNKLMERARDRVLRSAIDDFG